MEHGLKRALVLFLTFLMLFGVVACNDRPVQTGEVVNDTVQVNGTITLTYDATSEERERAPNAMIRAFTQKYPEARVNTDYSVGDINARISTGDIGDVFLTADMNVYTYAETNQALMPLDAYVPYLEIDTTQVYNAMYQMGVVNGRLYMTTTCFNQICLIYNKDAVLAEGLPLPQNSWTWEEFKDYAARLTKTSSDTGAYTQVGAYIEMQYSPIYTAFLVGFGGGKWYNEQEKKVNLTNEKVLAGVQEMVDVLQTGTVYSGSTILASAQNANYAQLGETDYVFSQIVHGNLSRQGPLYDRKDINWDIVSFPSLPVRAIGSGSIGFSVYNRTRQADTAAAFALFIFTEEGQLAYNGELGGSVPHIKSLSDEDFWRYPHHETWKDKNFDAFVSYPEAAIVGQVFNLVPYAVAEIIDKGMGDVLRDALQGKGTVSDLLGALETRASEKWLELQENA